MVEKNGNANEGMVDPATATQSGNSPGDRESRRVYQTKEEGEMGMTRKIAIGVITILIVILAVWGFAKYGKDTSPKMAQDSSGQPAISAEQFQSMVDQKVAAAMRVREGKEVDSRAGQQESTRAQIMQGADRSASNFALSFHQAALEENGLDEESAAWYSDAVHYAGANDESFYTVVNKQNGKLLDKFREGAKKAGVNEEDIVVLKETDEKLFQNTVANTAALIRRDPNADKIAEYIPIKQLAAIGYELGVSDDFNKASYKNEKAAMDKKLKGLSGRIWKNKKDLNGFYGKGLQWKKDATFTASTRLSNIKISTE